jgi:membrane-associated PAP2 superfamily phosphatase
MNFIKLFPVILSTLLLGAHFFRYGNIVLVMLTAALLPVLLVRRPWVVRLFQAVLVIGAIEWTRTLVELVKMRQAMGAPWIRLAVILGAVAVITICSAFVFRFKSLRERYKLK